jgi:hypothetical protein
LSVHLRQADLQAVIVQIGEQAGITIMMNPKDHRTISAGFTDVELEAGIRRLVRGASRSHTILYTREAAGTVAIKEVRVLGEESGGKPPQLAVSEAGGHTNGDNAVSHAALPLIQTQENSPPAGAEGTDVAARFRQAFELARRRVPQAASPATEEKENDVVRAFQDLLQQ